MRFPRWAFVASASAVAALFANATAVVPTAAADSAYTFVGLGNGHGRGMGQWGAYGYAQEGLKAEQILAHYYPEATLTRNPPSAVTVHLIYRDNKNLDVFSDAGMNVGADHIAAGQAVHLNGAGDYSVTDGCGGPVVRTGHIDNPKVDPIAAGADRPVAEHLHFCGGDTYRGSLSLADDGGLRTVNTVDVEDYLRGSIGAEMMASWADHGGFEALRSQAVAARSYALAENKAAYAQTCDTQSCQMYAGSRVEDPRTDNAVKATTGMVLKQDGQILHAEYSASTGGLTASGVVDEGDRIAPGHWEDSVKGSDIAKAFGVGDLQSFDVVDKAPDRHVVTVSIVGSQKTVTASAQEVQSKLGLHSAAFQFYAGSPAPAVPVAPNVPALPVPPEILANLPATGLPLDQLPAAVGSSQDLTKLVGSLSGPMLAQVLANLQNLMAAPK